MSQDHNQFTWSIGVIILYYIEHISAMAVSWTHIESVLKLNLNIILTQQRMQC